MKSKLSKDYPMGDASLLTFNNSWQTGIDPIFAARLVAAGVSIVSSGYRSSEEQARIIQDTLNEHSDYYLGDNGAVYNSAGQCMVSIPGSSWHNYGVAVDVEGDALYFSNEYLASYGLIKPMSYENWHIQPIETTLDGDMASYLIYQEAEEEVIVEKVKIDNVNDAVAVLVANGVVSSPEHWLQSVDCIKYQDTLLINMANKINELKGV